MNTIVLNQNNVVAGSNNSVLSYNFPNSVLLNDHQVAVSSISMYYSWNTINSSPLANNTFTYTWTYGSSAPVTYTVLIPDGMYEIADINAFLQYTFIMNGHYLINASGQNIYYVEFILAPTRYAVNINTYSVPLSLPTGWSLPLANTQTGALAWNSFPTVTFNPTITIPANFNLIVGYTSGFQTLPNLGLLTTLSYFSSIAPQVAPIPSLLITLTNISNSYSSPSSVLYSVVPNVNFGQVIQSSANEFVWCDFLKGTQNNLTLRFLGNNFSSVNILDSNMTIILLIRKKPKSLE